MNGYYHVAMWNAYKVRVTRLDGQGQVARQEPALGLGSKRPSGSDSSLLPEQRRDEGGPGEKDLSPETENTKRGQSPPPLPDSRPGQDRVLVGSQQAELFTAIRSLTSPWGRWSRPPATCGG